MIAKAVAFLEPLSFFFTTRLNYSIPTVSLGTQLSEEFPDCIIPEYDYRHFYKMLTCPRIQMNVTVSEEIEPGSNRNIQFIPVSGIWSL